MDKPRCAWVTSDEFYIDYHDREWGSFDQFHDEHYLFEMLSLEGAQAGLSWITILKRRESYRNAFAQFDPIKVSQFSEVDVEMLMNNEGIIRNRSKIESTIQNAKNFLKIQNQYGSFHEYLLTIFEQKLPIINHWETYHNVPAWTEQSKMLSKELKRQGFSFVGPTICYSFMQAVGIVNDHTTNCWLYDQ